MQVSGSASFSPASVVHPEAGHIVPRCFAPTICVSRWAERGCTSSSFWASIGLLASHLRLSSLTSTDCCYGECGVSPDRSTLRLERAGRGAVQPSRGLGSTFLVWVDFRLASGWGTMSDFGETDPTWHDEPRPGVESTATSTSRVER
jgi:hypothetical protein